MDTRTPDRPVFCYVVLAHTDAPTVLHLAARIRELSPGSAVLLRHAQDPSFLTVEDAAGVGARVLRSSIAVRWGVWSLTCAALEALEHARETTGATWLVLLSGQDYPVRDLAAWEDELVAGGAGAAFHHLERRDQDWQYRWRIVRPPARLGVVPARLRWVAERVWRRLLAPVVQPLVRFYRIGNTGADWALGVRRIEHLRRRPPVDVVNGSFWMALTGAALERVLVRFRGDPDLTAFFAPTLVPDHHYLQSVLTADPEVVVADALVTHQTVPDGEWNGVLLDVPLLEAAASTGTPFVRKVTLAVPEVVARADALAAADAAAGSGAGRGAGRRAAGASAPVPLTAVEGLAPRV